MAAPASNPLWRTDAVAFTVERARDRERQRGRNGRGNPCCGTGIIRQRREQNVRIARSALVGLRAILMKQYGPD